jgi:endonuclease YncB( thermonuclease family)
LKCSCGRDRVQILTTKDLEMGARQTRVSSYPRARDIEAADINVPNIWRGVRRPYVLAAFVLAIIAGMILGAVGKRAFAADAITGPAIISDADTIVVNGTRIRFDGIDAPEKDQPCLDEKGASYLCGIEAAKALVALIGGRAVQCDDLGEDTSYRNSKRRIGHCYVGDGAERIEINHWLVREGWAVNFEPYAKGRHVADEGHARANKLGMWKGCFTRPQEFRHWSKRRAQPLGLTCPANAKAALFPDRTTMPTGCEIKAKLAVRAYPYRGIYHLPDAGCRSYQKTSPHRWFCSEEEARDAGYRKAFNCRA